MASTTNHTSDSSRHNTPDQISEPVAILLLTSHAYSTPLQPLPQLKYDLRAIDNPPKALRDSHTGVSKRLREHMRSHQDFNDLLDRAEADILAPMTEALGESDDETDEGHSEDDDNDHDSNVKPTLSVAVFCARGHHRSVAFVEELAGRRWPAEWEVQVIHRDLHRERSGNGKRKRGSRQGRRAGGFDLVLGDE